MIQPNAKKINFEEGREESSILYKGKSHSREGEVSYLS